MKICLLSGTSIVNSSLFADWPVAELRTPYGVVTYRQKKNIHLINRHGPKGKKPPHAIPYRANIKGVEDLGCSHILSLNSVGSLREDLPPGTLISCGDYISFAPISFSDDELRASVPKVGNGLLPDIEKLEKSEIPSGKIYIQTRGPRFETPAEVRVLRGWGDVVGMTMASEADLANECPIDYTSLAMIDNFAHGIGEEPLTEELFRKRLQENQERVNELLDRIIGHYIA